MQRNYILYISSISISVTSTSVFAKTVIRSAYPPFEIQILLPFNNQCLPSSDSVALVLMEAASEPELGSVRQNAAVHSPQASRGRYFSFWASFPTIRIPC